MLKNHSGYREKFGIFHGSICSMSSRGWVGMERLIVSNWQSQITNQKLKTTNIKQQTREANNTPKAAVQ
jgi:hypothetical protein